MKNLPNEYVPGSGVRDDISASYKIGEQTVRKNEYNIWGVGYSLGVLLDTLGKSKYSRIIQFNRDSTKNVLYKWNKDRWVYCRGEE